MIHYSPGYKSDGWITLRERNGRFHADRLEDACTLRAYIGSNSFPVGEYDQVLALVSEAYGLETLEG